MPRVSVARPIRHGPSGGERVFADERGRLWSAAQTGEAMVFTCVSDGRESDRAIALTVVGKADEVGDEMLREWLGSAPRIGRLT